MKKKNRGKREAYRKGVPSLGTPENQKKFAGFFNVGEKKKKRGTKILREQGKKRQHKSEAVGGTNQ